MTLIETAANETILLTARKHWFVVMGDAIAVALFVTLPPLLWVLVVSAGLVVPTVFMSGVAHFVWLLMVLVGWIAFFAQWTGYYLDLWVVTDRRIFNLDQVGLFRRQATSCSLDRVQEITIETDGIWQTLFHFGTLIVETAGPTTEYITVYGLPHPERIRALIAERIERVGHLEETTKRQEQLLHMVAHEVKGYLSKNAAVLASIAEGDFGSVPDPLKSTAQAALGDTRTGVNTVTDILEGSNMSAGTLSLKRSRFDLRDALRALIPQAQASALQKGLSLELVIDQAAAMIEGDEDKLVHHVLRNLIDNAIRYTPSGSVTLGITTASGMIVFWTKDTGVGITPEDMQNLFTEGGHGTHSKEVNPASTGFGLFVAKQIVEAHGGRLWAESEGAGHGSTFYLVLPRVN